MKGPDSERFDELLEAVEEFEADVDEPGASRYLDEAYQSILGAKRMYEWEIESE